LAIRFLIHSTKIDQIIFGVKTIEHVKNILEFSKLPKLDNHIESALYELYSSDFGLENEQIFGY